MISLRSSICIYKAEQSSICPSVTPITHLGLPTWTYQLPNIINLSFSYFKFVTASEYGDQVAFWSRLKTKKWRNLEQYSIKNYSHMAQWVEQLRVWIQLVNRFFLKINTFCMHVFLKFTFDSTVLLGIPSTHQNGTWTKLNAHYLGTRLWWLLKDICFHSFITVRWRH